MLWKLIPIVSKWDFHPRTLDVLFVWIDYFNNLSESFAMEHSLIKVYFQEAIIPLLDGFTVDAIVNFYKLVPAGFVCQLDIR